MLATIPVVGFPANGLTYVAGESGVATTFVAVKRSGALADASRNFKSAVSEMRIIVKNFSAKPNDTLVQNYEKVRQVALRSLDFFATMIESSHAEIIMRLDKDVTGLHATFVKLVEEQKPSVTTTHPVYNAISVLRAMQSSASSMRT